MLLGQLAPQCAQRFPGLALLAAHQLTRRAGSRLWRLGRQLSTQLQGNLSPEQATAIVAESKATETFKIDVSQPASDQLAKQRPPLPFGQRLAYAENRQMLMTETADLLVVPAQKDVDQMAHTVALAATVDRRQGLSCRLGGIPGLHAVDTIVAMAARLRHLLIEIGQ